MTRVLRAMLAALASWSLGLDRSPDWTWDGPASHDKHGPFCDCLY